MSLMIEGWMPSVGSSSSSSFGRITSARPIASCCCWPPERSPPRRRSMSESTGNSENTSSGTLRWSRGSGAKPVSRFSSTVSSGKISRPCGTMAMPLARALDGRQRRDVAALEGDGALAHRMLADDGAQQAGLADAVAAEHAGDLAGLGMQRDAAQRLRRAVVQVDGVHVEHRSFAFRHLILRDGPIGPPQDEVTSP